MSEVRIREWRCLPNYPEYGEVDKEGHQSRTKHSNLMVHNLLSLKRERHTNRERESGREGQRERVGERPTHPSSGIFHGIVKTGSKNGTIHASISDDRGAYINRYTDR